jgi:hypothetical protein
VCGASAWSHVISGHRGTALRRAEYGQSVGGVEGGTRRLVERGRTGYLLPLVGEYRCAGNVRTRLTYFHPVNRDATVRDSVGDKSALHRGLRRAAPGLQCVVEVALQGERDTPPTDRCAACGRPGREDIRTGSESLGYVFSAGRMCADVYSPLSRSDPQVTLRGGTSRRTRMCALGCVAIWRSCR